jgi:undecaprenyl-diphosphatase
MNPLVSCYFSGHPLPCIQAKAKYIKGRPIKMKKKNQKTLLAAICMLAAFALWTMAVRCVDVRPIGPQGSAVGFASINRFVHGLTGVHLSLYTVTDVLSLIPLGIVMGFALLGLSQWVGRKSLWKVDRSILVLGGFYAAVMAIYLLFEVAVVNYRPVLINGLLEASYPSSTTMLVMCVMPTAAMQLHARIKKRLLRQSVIFLIIAFTSFMVIGRLISGVHWFSDIIGGALLSAGLVLMYHAVNRWS